MGAHLADKHQEWQHAVIRAAVIAVLNAFIIVKLVNSGAITVPLPYPAVSQVINDYPEDVFPWHPRPLEGAFTPNSRLKAQRLFEGQVEGSESVIVSPNGIATMLDKYGAVHEAVEQPDGTFSLNPKPRAWLGPGRPLGAGFNAQGDLYICDALKGLLLLRSGSNQVEFVTSRVSKTSPLEPDSPIIYANDLDIASDGTVYFTSSVDIILHRNAPHDSRWTHVPSLEGRAGFWDTIKGWGLGMCQGLPRGKLYRYDPKTGETHLLATGFFYSNGVAISADDSYLVISETDRLRLVKFWLQGPKAGTSEVLISHLPGTPDGVARAPDGSFWTALLVLPPPFTKVFALRAVRALLPHLPETIRPSPIEWGAAVKVAPDGEVLEWLQDPPRPSRQATPSAFRISSAHEHSGKLWLGALVADFVSYVDLTEVGPKPKPVPETWRPPVACETPPCSYVTHYH